MMRRMLFVGLHLSSSSSCRCSFCCYFYWIWICLDSAFLQSTKFQLQSRFVGVDFCLFPLIGVISSVKFVVVVVAAVVVVVVVVVLLKAIFPKSFVSQEK